MTEVTGREATTLHQLLYKRAMEKDGKLKFLDPKREISSNTALIVDEASMVGTWMHREILDQIPRGAVLIYVGDREQLPPVRDTWGPDFSNPTAVLTEIHRQAWDNPIISISMEIRTGGKLPQGTVGDAYKRGLGSMQDAAHWLISKLEAGEDAVVICWTNKARKKINRLARRLLAYDQEAQIVVGDRLRVLYNNRNLGRMNGEIVVVREIRPFKDSGAGGGWIQPTPLESKAWYVKVESPGRDSVWVFIHPDLIGADVREFRAFVKNEPRAVHERSWLHVSYGYSITVHSAQGSEYAHVSFIIDSTTKWLAKKDPEEARRLVYTAVTRAKQTLRVFDVK